jgi:hypothetical protein
MIENVKWSGSGILSPNTESGGGGGFGASEGAETNAGGGDGRDGRERSSAKAGPATIERTKDEAADPISALFSSLSVGRVTALFINLPPAERIKTSIAI